MCLYIFSCIFPNIDSLSGMRTLVLRKIRVTVKSTMGDGVRARGGDGGCRGDADSGVIL